MQELVQRHYANWLKSRRFLETTKQALLPFGLDDSVVEAALENAIMRQLLDLDERAPFDLVASLEPRWIERGFACVGVTAEPVIVATIDVHENFLDDRPAPRVEAEESAGLLRVGEFELERNTPVDRLLRYTKTQMPDEEAVQRVAVAALRYGSIYARTRHIGPPQAVYDAFYDWGVRNEGFASPFNSRLLGKEGARFFSAFARTDRVFGSRGSFFAAEHREYDGAWCVDPPFIEETMAKTDRIVQEWRAAGWDPGVIFIVPSSYDVEVVYDEVVELQAGHHHYEGLDGNLHPLPTGVSIYRIGAVEGWDAGTIEEGYRPGVESDVA